MQANDEPRVVRVERADGGVFAITEREALAAVQRTLFEEMKNVESRRLELNTAIAVISRLLDRGRARQERE